MANIERLTKRVKQMEEWIEENETIGGPQGTLETFNFLINEARRASMRTQQTEQQFQQLRTFAFEFIKEHELEKEWDTFLEDKDAVQKQQTEEIPVQEEAESGEEAVEAPKEEDKQE